MFLVKPLAGDNVVLLHGTFESSTTIDNPWAGASTTGVLAVQPGSQPAVSNSGNVAWTPFAPSVAVGDLNGDGLPDLVVGDPHGFIWFFPNTGTATQPKFTQGEIMPVWIGAVKGDPDYGDNEGGGVNTVPRVQLVSLQGTKLLDLVIGNYNGRLFYIHNMGSLTQPVFKLYPSRQKDSLVKTRKDGLLWCNFLCPFLYDWWGTGQLDLIMGDGSYAANSVFLFKNTGNRDAPTFDIANMTKIIPGMGRENITPQVVDWNNDGKPDIIAGCQEESGATRVGRINVFVNTSADVKQPVPTFDAGQAVSFGGKDTFGTLPTVTVCDLTGNKLPNLIVANNTGTMAYVTNIGKPGAPEFGNPVPIAGVNSFPKILRPIAWSLRSPFGVPNELLVCTNATVQPGFEPPPDTTFKNALRYYVYPVSNKYFPESYYPVSDPLFDDEHWIYCPTPFVIKDDTQIHVSFWIRTSGNISNLTLHLPGHRIEPGEDDEKFEIIKSIGSASSWNLFEDSVSYNFKNKVKTDASSRHESGQTTLRFQFSGQGEIYLDDVKVSMETP